MMGGSGFAIEIAAPAKGVGKTAVPVSSDECHGSIAGRNVDRICVISTDIYVLSLPIPVITHTIEGDREV